MCLFGVYIFNIFVYNLQNVDARIIIIMFYENMGIKIFCEVCYIKLNVIIIIPHDLKIKYYKLYVVIYITCNLHV